WAACRSTGTPRWAALLCAAGAGSAAAGTAPAARARAAAMVQSGANRVQCDRETGERANASPGGSNERGTTPRLSGWSGQPSHAPTAGQGSLGPNRGPFPPGTEGSAGTASGARRPRAADGREGRRGGRAAGNPRPARTVPPAYGPARPPPTAAAPPPLRARRSRRY